LHNARECHGVAVDDAAATREDPYNVPASIELRTGIAHDQVGADIARMRARAFANPVHASCDCGAIDQRVGRVRTDQDARRRWQMEDAGNAPAAEPVHLAGPIAVMCRFRIGLDAPLFQLITNG
jgi:hypothetical protein